MEELTTHHIVAAAPPTIPDTYPMHVLLAGSLTLDHNVLGGANSFTLGGAIAHSSVAYLDQGAELSVAFRSRATELAAIEELLGSRVAFHHERSANTTTFTNRYAASGDRTQTIDAIAPPISVAPQIEKLTADLVHLAPLHQQDLDASWYRLPGNLAVDVQGLLRPSRIGRVRMEATPELDGIIRRARYLKAGQSEWEAVLAALDTTEAQCLEHYPGTEIIVTCGADGGKVISHGQIPITWTSTAQNAALDPTGAGDMFFAHYLTSRLKGATPHRSASTAAAMTSASLVSRRLTALPPWPTPASEN